MEDRKLNDLAHKYLTGAASPEEEAELHAWWDSEMNTEDEQVVVTKQPETAGTVRDRMLGRINEEINKEEPAIIKRLDRRWLIAASVILVVAGWSITRSLTREHPPTQYADDAISAARAIKPGGNKATLELPTGRIIALDSVKEGLVAAESDANVTKTGGDRLVYSVTNHEEGAYNTIHTPKGGQYQVQLPDGSNVWLNAASSIRFPSAFGKQRRVELTGEAYFEVANDPNRPFMVVVSPVVDVPACEVTVLGTDFDIDSYTDGSAIRATLLKGSLKITTAASKRPEVLKPGQQAVIDHEHHLTVNDSPDSAKVLAWREGLFRFHNDSIQEVMTQIARWFDVEVVYSGKTSEHFVSTLPRNADLYDDLQTLERTGRVRFEVRGRTVTVFPH
jgi:ferric-dicitrate binding protein FerR (iron transport regulator)